VDSPRSSSNRPCARGPLTAILSGDINAVVQAAIGGAPVTQVIQGDRRFDLAVRYPEANRSTPEAISALLIPTPDGTRIPLGQIANVSIREGKLPDLPRAAAATSPSSSAFADATLQLPYRSAGKAETAGSHADRL